MKLADYKPPFVWFGGKSSVAETVWAAFGDLGNYVEPFFGSGAVLFLRPGGAGPIETINDADGFVANFWRSLQRDSDAVADFADWPVNEADLHARHLWLLGQRERITERLMGDPDYFDAKVAGWWVWGLNCWIGSGWCSGKGPWISEGGVMVMRNTGQGVNRQRPHLGNTGQGVNRQLPHLGNTGKGVNRQLPHLGNTGKGVNRKLPHLGNTGKGDEPETPSDRRQWMRGWLGELSARIARVRVCCGDWSRVCGPSVTYRHLGITGVFLDPPYADTAKRTSDLYATDCESVAHDVRKWAIEEGKRSNMRIILCGYEGEHDMPGDWRVIKWKSKGGYSLANTDEDGFGRVNSARERLWLSPACIDPEAKVESLWSPTNA